MRPKKPRRHVSCKRRVERVDAVEPNEGWSMDFMHDQLFDGRRFRLLTLVDNPSTSLRACFSRESLAIGVNQSLKGIDVVNVLERVSKTRKLPRTIRVDNGAEFTSKILDQWAYLNGVELDFIRPGKPTENGLIGSSNGRVREECLNESWFLSIEDAREKIEAWRQHYN
jgi:putative transposase